jgi:FtsP/CotA-like multicopper oxidase with cupredoxin domain
VQRADGLYGGFIIHKPVEKRGALSDLSIYKYEQEKLLLIGDWYHRPGRAVLDWYRNPDHYGYEVRMPLFKTLVF